MIMHLSVSFRVSQIPIFKIVVILTNKLFNRSDPTLTSASAARGSTTKR